MTKINTTNTMPELPSDKVAEHFIENADLSTFDLSNFKKTTFEFAPKSHTVSLRLSKELYTATQQKARLLGMNAQQFMRHAIERAI